MNKAYYTAYRSITIVSLLLLFSTCTNYSSEQQQVNAPVLLEIQSYTGGHLIRVSAQNNEIGFQGYRLYQGINENEARNRAEGDGIDCSFPLREMPNRSVYYYLEAVPNKSGPDDVDKHLCNVPLSLTPGTWISIRGLIFQDIQSVKTSIPSNALPVP